MASASSIASAIEVNNNNEHSLFERLAASNVMPSNEAKLAAQQREEAIEEELSLLWDRIRELKAEKQKLQCIQAPIRYVPADVFLEIFKNVLLSKDECPVDLSRVCRSWRNIIHAAPQLWNRLRIHPHNETDCQTFFLRPGNKVPLSVTMGSCDWDFEKDDYASWLPPYSHRIESLKLIGSSLDVQLEGLVNLRSLELILSSLPYVDNVIFRANTDLPLLRQLRLVNMEAPTPLPNSLQHLTEVEIQQELSYREISNILDFLPECLQLQQLTIVDPRGDFYGSDSEWSGSQPKVLQRLETLKLAVHVHTYVFLRQLTLPRLMRMDITGAENHWLDDFEDMALRSEFALEHCTMRMCKPFDGNTPHLPIPEIKWYERYTTDFSIHDDDHPMQELSEQDERDRQVSRFLSIARTVRTMRVIDSAFLSATLALGLKYPEYPYDVEDPQGNRKSDSPVAPYLQHLWIEHTECNSETRISNLENEGVLRLLEFRDGFTGEVDKEDDDFVVYRSGRPTLAVKDRSIESLKAEYTPCVEDGVTRHIFF